MHRTLVEMKGCAARQLNDGRGYAWVARPVGDKLAVKVYAEHVRNSKAKRYQWYLNGEPESFAFVNAVLEVREMLK